MNSWSTAYPRKHHHDAMLLPLRTQVRPSTISLPRLAVLVTLSLLLLYTYFRDGISIWGTKARLGKFPTESTTSDQNGPDLAETLGTILEDYSPAAFGPITGGKKSGAETGLWPPNEKDDLMDILKMSPKQILAMREAHSGFVQAINEKLPDYTAQALGTSRGIVTVGGSKYNPSLMVSLRLLRRTGSEFPVEVFMPEDEYEPEVCKEHLPQLNAACRTFPAMNHTIAHYQFKIFALLFSSFSEVLWLDADNFPLHDVAPLFDARPFRETGLVTWPDLWRTTISPAYYLVSGQAPEAVQARASTESGQLLVSKDKHWKTLLLAAYYNYYGPDHYYALLCQGGAGIGDKETFLPAAEAMGLPFYQVRASPERLGHYKSNEMTRLGIHTFALLQHDLLHDYEVTVKLEEEEAKEEEEARVAALKQEEEGANKNTTTTSTTSAKTASRDVDAAYSNVAPFFLHMSTPKWDAKNVFDHVGEYDLTWDRSLEPAAAYRDPPEAAAKIEGVERMVWEEARWVACHLEDVLGWWEGARGEICTKIVAYFDEVLDTELGEELGLAGGLVPAPYIP